MMACSSAMLGPCSFWHPGACGQHAMSMDVVRAVQAEVLAAALHADAWPHLTLALGLATGQVLLLRGEAGAQPLTCTACTAPDEHVHAKDRACQSVPENN